MTKQKLIELLTSIYLNGYYLSGEENFEEYFEEFYPDLIALAEDEE
jgi:hypothetical protein